MNNLDHVYLIGHRGPEHTSIHYICLTYDKALKAFHAVRKHLIKDAMRIYGDERAEELIRDCDFTEEEAQRISKLYKTELQVMVKNLGEKDPEKINNHPFKTPFIWKKKIDKEINPDKIKEERQKWVKEKRERHGKLEGS